MKAYISQLARRSARSGLILITAASLGLSACVPTEQSGPTSIGAINVNRVDQCQTYLQPFVELREERAKRIAQWAALGAAAGVGIAAANKGSNRDLLIGLIGGALLGAAGGYLADLQKRGVTTANIRSAIDQDARKDTAQSDRLISALNALNSCRIREITAVTAAVRGGKMEKSYAVAMLQSIGQSVKNDNRVIGSVLQDLQKTRTTYVNALQASGVSDANSYVSSLNSYKPKVTAPRLTSGRTEGSLGVTKYRSGAPISNLVASERELDAANAAHAASLSEMLADAKAQLL
jgi:hypothetical protein